MTKLGLPVLAVAVLLCGCGQVSYYSQAVGGQWQVISKRQPVAAVVSNPETSDELRETLKEEAVKYLGKSLKPEEVKFVEALPKTRSAKIVRGAIKRIYIGEDPDTIDTSSIEVPEFLHAITKAV